MFPDLAQAQKRALSRLDKVAATTWFRLLVAVLLVVMHLSLFAKAGHD